MMYEKADWERLLEQLELRDCVLDGINIDIYVSDMASHQILYTNMEPTQEGCDGSFTGKICWEVLKDRKKRCEFCPVTYLLKNPGKSYQQEFLHENGYLLVYDSIIPWRDGKLVHLHYSLNTVSQ